MNIRKLIVESSFEIIEIGKLTDIIIEFIAEKNHSIISKLKLGYDLFDTKFPVNEFFLTDVVNDNDFSKYLKPFLRQKEIKIKIVDNINVTALYRNDTIFLNVNSKNFIASLNKNIGLNLRSKILLKKVLETSFRISLSHELQHAIDDYKSEGSYVKNKSDIEFSKKYNMNNNDNEFFSNPENIDLYHSLPSEINAKLTEILLSSNPDATIEIFLNEFKKKFINYDKQDQKIKNKLLKVAYKYFNHKNDSK